ncbi:hypothetical protein B0T22DRAFT_70230 [Podospora appendiculata]|uniref:Uncharacterized protein n=1 Tax=Podospora appendiculata TaxID=314037 RepID=A0AAE1CHL4_9PEZI|nr:hypothetical protein B0T22DRAFT_70230 [Podospora appendiculata]
MDEDEGTRGVHLRGNSPGAVAKLIQAIARFVAVLLGLATVTVVGWIYGHWKWEPTVRVDILFPSFFPVIVGILMDSYEVVSLLFLTRRSPVNIVAVAVDVAIAIASVVCFLIIGLTDYGSDQSYVGWGSRRPDWAIDMNNCMIFMIVFCLLHVLFIVMAFAGCILNTVRRNRARLRPLRSKNQAELVQFTEAQRIRAEMGQPTGLSGRLDNPAPAQTAPTPLALTPSTPTPTPTPAHAT